MLSDSELLALARREVDDALGYDADILASKRESALDYYHGNMRTAPLGRSSIVSKDVADTVHGLLAQTTTIFKTTLIRFAAQSEDDEQQAQLESDYCRYMFEKSNGWKLLNEGAHDALLIGNGWLKITVEPSVTVDSEKYGELDKWQLQAVERPKSENEEVTVSKTKNGYTVRRAVTTFALVVECIAPESMLFSKTSGQFDLSEQRLVGERKLFTVNALKEMGLTDEEAGTIPDSEDDYWPGTRAREGLYQDETGNEQAYQLAERLKECFDVYVRVDLNDDNTSELRHIIFGGNTLIVNEPANCIPYATGSPVPMPHRIQGTGMFELIGAVQDTKTDVLRAYIDNLDVMNGSRLGVLDGDVNMDDATSGRLNGLIRMKRPDAIFPIPATDIGMQAITGLNYMDTVRSQRGGQSVDMNEADRQLMASSATAAAGAMESSERMAGWYASNLVNTLFKSAYQLIHKKLRLEMPGEVQANLRGKWVKTDPGEWKERENELEIVAGMTTTERNTKISGLNVVIGKIEALIGQGGEGVITSYTKLYEAMGDWIRASELGSAEDYLIDPMSEEAQKAQQEKQKQQQQQQQQMQQQQQQIMEMQKQIEQAKVDFDYYKTDNELKFKYYDADLDAQEAEAKITTDTIAKLSSVKNDTNRTGENSS
jgi:hypothetical protein